MKENVSLIGACK